MSIINNIKAVLPDLTGSLRITKEPGRVILITGQVSSSGNTLEEILRVVQEKYPEYTITPAFSTTSELVIIDDNEISMPKTENTLDNVSVIYSGLLDIDVIRNEEKFKRINQEYKERIKACVEVVGFIAPIVLDSKLNVIDGGLRLEIARELGWTEVQTVIIDTADERADFLRLVLNRSSEFQRWQYSEVDEYADNMPQLQVLLEPLGIFGKTILPTSFFSNTVIGYKLDEFNEQQQKYRQEIGIAEWARLQRERAEAAEARKQKRKDKAKKSNNQCVSLFDLVPTEADKVPTYDVDKVISEHVKEMKDVAERITVNYDKKRKAELESKGKEWQGSRRTSIQKSRDLRREAELKSREENKQ